MNNQEKKVRFFPYSGICFDSMRKANAEEKLQDCWRLPTSQYETTTALVRNEKVIGLIIFLDEEQRLKTNRSPEEAFFIIDDKGRQIISGEKHPNKDEWWIYYREELFLKFLGLDLRGFDYLYCPKSLYQDVYEFFISLIEEAKK